MDFISTSYSPEDLVGVRRIDHTPVRQHVQEFLPTRREREFLTRREREREFLTMRERVFFTRRESKCSLFCSGKRRTSLVSSNRLRQSQDRIHPEKARKSS